MQQCLSPYATKFDTKITLPKWRPLIQTYDEPTKILQTLFGTYAKVLYKPEEGHPDHDKFIVLTPTTPFQLLHILTNSFAKFTLKGFDKLSGEHVWLGPNLKSSEEVEFTVYNTNLARTEYEDIRSGKTPVVGGIIVISGSRKVSHAVAFNSKTIYNSQCANADMVLAQTKIETLGASVNVGHGPYTVWLLVFRSLERKDTENKPTDWDDDDWLSDRSDTRASADREHAQGDEPMWLPAGTI